MDDVIPVLCEFTVEYFDPLIVSVLPLILSSSFPHLFETFKSSELQPNKKKKYTFHGKEVGSRFGIED